MRRRALILLLVVASIVAVAAVWGSYAGQVPATTGTIKASGSIEADQTVVASELAGRIREILADEGAAVKRGEVLARLDDALLGAQIAQAQSNVALAGATLSQVRAGARPEDVAGARAAAAQAAANRDGARQAWLNAQRGLANPQELGTRLDGARTQLAIAQRQVIQGQAALEAARVQRDRYRDQESYAKQVVAAEEAMRVSEANVERVEAQLAGLLDVQMHPLAAQAQLDQAQAAYQVALSAAEAAQARLEALAAGATSEQVAVAQAALRQAEAGLAMLAVQREKMTVRSPLDGVIASRALRPGELAAAGAPIVTVADLTRARLTVYIPEDQIGLVRLGQQVRVTVDSFPGRTFLGQVTFISQQAEFTPKNVQTQKERVNTVFGVRVSLSNPDLLLKPGVPADAIIGL
jgi:HlyD family secretion protein